MNGREINFTTIHSSLKFGISFDYAQRETITALAPNYFQSITIMKMFIFITTLELSIKYVSLLFPIFLTKF